MFIIPNFVINNVGIIFEVLVRRSEDGNAIGLRIVETMDLVPKHSMYGLMKIHIFIFEIS